MLQRFLILLKMLHRLLFGGGTMLKLCHGLNRFSVDLDFWLYKVIDEALRSVIRGQEVCISSQVKD